MSTLATNHGGGRDQDADRDASHYGLGAGGKKRKTPHFPLAQGPGGVHDDQSPAYAYAVSSDDGSEESSPPLTGPYHPSRTTLRNYRLAHSAAAKAGSFRRAVFLRRKAALITLYLDAQAVDSGNHGASAKGVKTKGPVVPDVASFERLLPHLEEVGPNDWAPDRPGWRANIVDAEGPKLFMWGVGTKRRRLRQRARIERRGLAPEGSFEFERNTKGVCAKGDLSVVLIPRSIRTHPRSGSQHFRLAASRHRLACSSALL